MYIVWSLYGVISINTWLWSTVFHTRDFDWTEKLDYFCAFSIVIYSLLAFFIRIFGSPLKSTFSSATTVACIAIYVHHIYNMTYVHFDYGYNMMVNIIVGGVNSVCWLFWCFFHRRQDYVKKALIAVLLLNVSILLEVLEFTPIWWLIDSHALWHLSTSPVHFIWYDFIIQDCKYLMKSEETEDEKKLV